MPIYEFKCLKCGEFIEHLIMNNEDECELKCKKCDSTNLERVMSTTSFSMGNGAGAGKNTGSSVETKTCASGSCHTYTIPGHSK